MALALKSADVSGGDTGGGDGDDGDGVVVVVVVMVAGDNDGCGGDCSSRGDDVTLVLWCLAVSRVLLPRPIATSSSSHSRVLMPQL